MYISARQVCTYVSYTVLFLQAIKQSIGIVAPVWLPIIAVIRSSHILKAEARLDHVATLDELGLVVGNMR